MPIESVRDAMHDFQRGSKHIRTRRQAIAAGLAAERKHGKRKRRKARKGRHRRSDR